MFKFYLPKFHFYNLFMEAGKLSPVKKTPFPGRIVVTFLMHELLKQYAQTTQNIPILKVEILNFPTAMCPESSEYANLTRFTKFCWRNISPNPSKYTNLEMEFPKFSWSNMPPKAP